MSTNTGWGRAINSKYQSTMNSKIVLDRSDAMSLGNAVNSLSLPGVILGSWTQFTSSFMAYPFKVSYDGVPDKTLHLVASGVSFPDIKVRGVAITSLDFGGYTLGEYFFAKPESYLGYEPYSKCEIYLPYYGFTQLKITDIAGKYIQFRLNIDYSSGQGLYTISCSDNPVNDNANLPYINKTNGYSDCRVLTTLSFQIGYSIPITNANFNDTVRNMATMAVKASASIIHAGFDASTSKATETVKEVTTGRNPKSGRQIQKGTRTETTEYERHTYRKGSAVNTAINSAATILGNLSAHGGSDRPNNTALNKCAGVNVAIIIKSVIPTFNTFSESSYKHLVGLPLGQCKKLSTLKGYTKITDLHLEGTNFGQITSKEFSELESLCLDGIILP